MKINGPGVAVFGLILFVRSNGSTVQGLNVNDSRFSILSTLSGGHTIHDNNTSESDIGIIVDRSPGDVLVSNNTVSGKRFAEFVRISLYLS